VIFASVLTLVISMVGQSGADSALADAASSRIKESDDHARKETLRVITESTDKASAALKEGCQLARETKKLKALICKREVAESLGLDEDIRVFKTDIAANAQIEADSVQVSGNGGNGRKIVILDTGYNYEHPDLSSSYLGGKDFVNNDGDPMDDNGHGSHVAGLITSDGKYFKSKGAAPATGIISGKVLDGNGWGYFSDLIAAMYWAVDGPDGIAGTSDDFKADAISMSMGSLPPFVYKTHCDAVMPSMTSAIKYALSRGVLVIVAAGNHGTLGVSIPGCISHSITVGSVNKSDKVSSFSGRGRGVDLTAPGVSLISTSLGTGYSSSSGTSMATPLVSATVALIKHEHPWYSAAKVRNALFDTAKDLGKVGRDYGYGYGRVVASASVAY
jgi:subtilisin family serine protease